MYGVLSSSSASSVLFFKARVCFVDLAMAGFSFVLGFSSCPGCIRLMVCWYLGLVSSVARRRKNVSVDVGLGMVGVVLPVIVDETVEESLFTN